MRKWIFCLVLVGVALGAWSQQGTRDKLIKKKVILPGGWALTPAGRNLPLGDLPLNIAVSPGKKYLAVTRNGQGGQVLQLIDAGREKIVDDIAIPASCQGMQFGADEKTLYILDGRQARVLRYEIVRGRLVAADSIGFAGGGGAGRISPAGLDVDDSKRLLYVVTRGDNALYVIDLAGRAVVRRFDLAGEGYACRLSENKEQLYITCRGCNKLVIFDTKTGRFAGEMPVGADPGAICRGRGGLLFVANTTDNSVSVIDLAQHRVIKTLEVALYRGLPGGSAANALALSGDEKTLYIANGVNNCLTVFDVSNPASCQVRGLIPVGWGPTAIEVVEGKLFVANGKGFSSLVNPGEGGAAGSGSPITYHNGVKDRDKKIEYIAGLFTGSLSIVREPDEKLLGVYSNLVYQNCPYSRAKQYAADTRSVDKAALSQAGPVFMGGL